MQLMLDGPLMPCQRLLKRWVRMGGEKTKKDLPDEHVRRGPASPTVDCGVADSRV